MKTKLLTGLLILGMGLNLNAWGIKDLLHNIDDGIHHIHIKSMNEAEYTNRTLKKDTDFATVSVMRTHGRDFMLLIKPKTKNILIKIQTENNNQIISNLNDVNLSRTYRIDCRYINNLAYECKSIDSDYNLIDYESFKLENGRNYLTIQNPFDDKVKTIGWFDVTGDNLSFERK
jgi:hypothetical protein